MEESKLPENLDFINSLINSKKKESDEPNLNINFNADIKEEKIEIGISSKF